MFKRAFNTKNNLVLRIFFVGVAMFIAGIVLVITSVSDSNKLKHVKDLSTMRVEDFKKGDFVEGDIYLIMDEFAYMEEYDSTFGVKHNSRVASRYFVFPLEGAEYDQYAALEIGNTDLANTAAAMCDEFYSVYVEDKEISDPTSIHITGKIKKMDKKIEEYFYEWGMYGEEDQNKSNYTDIAAPLEIQYYAPGFAERSITTGAIIAVIGGIITGAFVFIWLKNKREGTSDEASSIPAPSAPFYTGTVRQDDIMQDINSTAPGNSNGSYQPANTDLYSSSANAYQPTSSGSYNSAASGGTDDSVSLQKGTSSPASYNMDSIDTAGMNSTDSL